MEWFWIGFWFVWATELCSDCIRRKRQSGDEAIADYCKEWPRGMVLVYFLCVNFTAIAVGAFCDALASAILAASGGVG